MKAVIDCGQDVVHAVFAAGVYAELMIAMKNILIMEGTVHVEKVLFTHVQQPLENAPEHTLGVEIFLVGEEGGDSVKFFHLCPLTTRFNAARMIGYSWRESIKAEKMKSTGSRRGDLQSLENQLSNALGL